MFVGRLGRENIFDRTYDGHLAFEDAQVAGTFLLHPLEFVDGHNAVGIDILQLFSQIGSQARGIDIMAFVVKCFMEGGNLRIRNLCVVLEIGLDEVHQTVALGSQLFFALEDGERVFCDEGFAVPGLTEMEVVADEPLSWH